MFTLMSVNVSKQIISGLGNL